MSTIPTPDTAVLRTVSLTVGKVIDPSGGDIVTVKVNTPSERASTGILRVVFWMTRNREQISTVGPAVWHFPLGGL